MLVPGTDRLAPGRGRADAKVHPVWRRLYEQSNKFGVVTEYIGPHDITDEILAPYAALYLMPAPRLSREQEQCVLRFVRGGRALCIMAATPLAGQLGVVFHGNGRQNALVWRNKSLAYRAVDERGFVHKIARRLFREKIPSGWGAPLPVMRVSVSAEHEILARWQNVGWPALTRSRAGRGTVVYFSGILAGAEEALVRYVISLIAEGAPGKVPAVPAGKKCCVTLFHDYEGSYGNSRWGSADAEGLRSLLALEKKYRIRATFHIVGKLVESAPETIRQIIADGHEIAAHTYEHAVPRLIDRRTLERSIAACVRLFQERFGKDIKGFRSPQAGWSADLVALLARYGFAWEAEDEAATVPYRLVLDRQLPLLRIPVSGDDYGYISSRLSPREMLARFKLLVVQGIDSSGFVSIGFHPWIESMDPERLAVLEEFFAYLTALPEVAIMTFGEVCDWWNRRSGEASLSGSTQPTKQAVR